MKKSIFISILMVFAMSCSCVKKPGPTLKIEDKWKVWLSDSAGTFKMKSSGGLSETYQGGTKATISTGGYTNQVSPFVCEEGDTEYAYLIHKSSVNNYEFEVRVSAVIGTTQLSIRFQDVYLVWDLVNDQTSPATFLTRTFETQKIEIDSMVINGHLFHKIWKFTIIQPVNLTPHEARTVYIAQHYGLIKYEEEGGIIWERE